MVATQEAIERAVATFESAARANRETTSLSGSIIRLPNDPESEIMITADLHGQRLTFERLIEFADLDRHPKRHLVMQEVCHGGPCYPRSTGCMSHLLVEDIAACKVRYGDRFHFILSNHEWAELTDFPIMKSNKMLNLMFRAGMQEIYGADTARVHQSLLEFIGSCPIGIRFTNVFVCHSAPEDIEGQGFDAGLFDRPLEPEDYAPHSDLFRMLWGRDFSEKNAQDFAELVQADIIIHGHEPCPEGFRVPNSKQIILDCCGRHACFVILNAGQNWEQSDIVDRIRGTGG